MLFLNDGERHLNIWPDEIVRLISCERGLDERIATMEKCKSNQERWGEQAKVAGETMMTQGAELSVGMAGWSE